MLDKLKNLNEKHKKLEVELSNPDVVSDLSKFKKLNKELKELSPVISKYKEYKKILDDISGNKELIEDKETDSDLREMAELELSELDPRKAEIEEELKLMLVPRDPNDSENAIVEIRAGTGGDEAGIFAGNLYRMYVKYAAARSWKTEVLSIHESEKGGYKEIVIQVSGEDVYGALKYESGVHRVQRVPDTETQGRVHTSAATVAVLLESDEVEIEINETDLKIDTYRSSGAGGQHVNTTDSAVRITHLPTNVVVTCQDEKSQIKNRDKAMKHLKVKLYDIEMQKQAAKMKVERQLLVGSGDRSAKIRTYNYPQSRCTDHRINLTSYNLDKVMDGDLFEFTEKLQIADLSERMSYTEESN
jgi:peptide chain release factor 1